MTDKKRADELTELEPIEPDDLPELPELEEAEELPELPADARAQRESASPDPKPRPRPPEHEPEPEPEPEPPAPTPPPPRPDPTPPPPEKPSPTEPRPAPSRPEPTPSPPPEPRPAPSRPEPPPPAPQAAGAPEPSKPAGSKPEPAPADEAAEAARDAPAALAEEPLGSHPGVGAPGDAGGTSGKGAGDAPPSGAATPPGEKPPLRELDKAPTHLKKAALICAAGSLLPWLGHGGGWMTAGLAKALVVLGAWLWLKQIDHNWGPKLSGVLGKLGELELIPKKKETKPKRRSKLDQDRPTVLTHAFPTGLHLLSLIAALGGALVLPFVEGLTGGSLGKAVAELGMLAWAAYTFVHIHSYERWGPFNPIFPLMFLAMLISGLFNLPTALSAEGPLKLAMLAGSAVVALGGALAAFTIVEAMMQAKKEGDAKKAAALEARRQARKQKRR